MEVLYHIRPYFAGIFPKNRPEKLALYMVGTSILGSWNSMKFPLIYPPSLSVLVEKTVTHHESVGGNTPNTRLYVNVCRFTHAQNTNTRSKHGCFEIWDTEFVQINGLACSILVVGDISVCPASSIYKHLHIYITPSQKIGLSFYQSIPDKPSISGKSQRLPLGPGRPPVQYVQYMQCVQCQKVPHPISRHPSSPGESIRYPLVMTNIAMENPNHKWRFRISMGHRAAMANC